MRVDRTSIKWTFALVGLLATASLVAGCGGGGGGGGGPSSGTNYRYAGTVEDQSGNPIAGDIVTFDASSVTGTTAANGTFALSVPAADLSAAGDMLTVTNSSGVTETVYDLPVGAKGATGLVIKIGPPPPPPASLF